MTIFTIKVDNAEDTQKLKKTIKQLTSAKVSLIDDKEETESISMLKKRIQQSRKKVSQGRFMKDTEFENISNEW